MNKQKKGLKAILALLLTLTLVIGMVPASALAETADAITDGTQIADTIDGSGSTGDATTPTEGETATTPEDATATPGTEDETATPTEETTARTAESVPVEGGAADTAALANDAGEVVIAPNAISPRALTEHTVPGTVPIGTTVNIFDYGIEDIKHDYFLSDYLRNWIDSNNQALGKEYTSLYSDGINEGHSLKFGRDGADDNSTIENGMDAYMNSWKSGYISPNIVKNRLENGYPVLNNDQNESLKYLFDDTWIEGAKEAYMDVDGLFMTDDDGYYYYNSAAPDGNFASFAPSGRTGSFTLYDTWGVQYDSSEVAEHLNGQFFPFNTGEDVFTENWSGLTQKNGVSSTGKKNNGDHYGLMNHYFGVSMSSQFIQDYGGRTKPVNETGSRDVTYEFSGDDDVWIFIDGVLVADLGGTHNKASVSINFQTGEVIITDNGKTQTGDEIKTLRDYFDAAGALEATSWSTTNENTFADGTTHTLDFFYLERGSGNSNMSLKFNFIYRPQSNIIKVDQDKQGVAGATYELYQADVDYNYVAGATYGDYICTATTNYNGEVVLKKDDGTYLQLEDLYTEYNNDGQAHYVLKETNVPAGYRSAGDIKLRIEKQKGDYIILSSNPWETGAYAQAKLTATAPTTFDLTKQLQNGNDTIQDNINLNDSGGRLFAVVMKRTAIADTSDPSNDNWVPVYGDALNGWNVMESSDMQNIIIAAQENPYLFDMTSEGSWKATVENLPGDIMKYYFMADTPKSTAEYYVAYFYTTASSLAEATPGNTAAVANQDPTADNDGFQRDFSTNLYVSNIVNRLLVQKLDENGDPISVTSNNLSAEFALYEEDEGVTVDEEGNVTIDTNATPYKTAITADLTDPFAINGAAVFNAIETGTYYLVETRSPDGYVKSNDITKIIVDNTGVHVNAGTAEDDISVQLGVGKIVKSMLQFAADDQVNATLHDIVATLQQAGTEPTGDSGWIWENNTTVNPNEMHLNYSPDDATIEYKATTENGPIYLESEAGWPRLEIQQCLEHESETGTANSNKQNLGKQSLVNLFSGTVNVQVRNQKVGDLTIEKQVTGLPANGEDATFFSFEVSLPGVSRVAFDVNNTAKVKVNNSNPEQTEGNTATVTDGKLNIELQNDGTITFTDLNNGQAYTVTETGDTTGYVTQNTVNNNPSQDDKTTGERTLDGNAANNVTFTNEKTYSLDISKILAMADASGGDFTDRTKDFTVQVTLTDGNTSIAGIDNNSLKAVLNDGSEVKLEPVAGETGVYTFKIKGDQTVTLSGIPYDAQFSVVETGLESSRYTASYKQGVKDEELTDYNNSKVSMNSANHAVEITNTMSDVPVTGSFFDNNATNVLMVIASIAILGLAALGIWRYKRTHA